MNKLSPKNLRTLYVLAFAVIIFGPIFFIKTHLEQGFEISKNRVFNLAKRQLVVDMQDYKNDLDPANGLKNLMEEIEIDFNIVSAASLVLNYQKLQDPEIITDRFIPELLNKLKHRFSLSPLCIIGSNCDIRNFFYWFSPKYFSLTQNKMMDFCKGMFVCLLDGRQLKPFLNDPNMSARYNSLCKQMMEGFKYYEDKTVDLFRKYLSVAGFLPDRSGLVYPMACNSFEADKIFLYPRLIFDKESMLGGYVVFFTNLQILPELLLKLSRHRLSQTDLSRDIVEIDLKNAEKFIFKNDDLIYYNPVPSAFLAHLAYFNRPNLKTRLKKSLLSVSLNYKKLICPVINAEDNLNFFIKLFLAFFVFCSSYFILFGLPINLKLRAKMVASASLLVFIPCMLLGYFSNELIDNFEKLTIKEIQIMAQQKMYELNGFLRDLSCLQMLSAQSLKLQLSQIVNKSKDSIMSINARKLKGISVLRIAHLYLSNGLYRRFSYHEPYENKEKKLFKSASVNYLNNLGVLDKKFKSVKKDLATAILTVGLLDEFNKKFVEANAMKCECYETHDFTQMESLDKMIYFLISDAKNIGRILGISFIQLEGKSNFQNIYYNLTHLPPSFFVDETDGIYNEYLIGARKPGIRFVKSWAPTVFGYESPQRKLLDYAAKSETSGFSWEEKEDLRKVYSWQSFEDNAFILGGSSSAKPDRLANLMITMLPFSLLAFSLLSLFILGDILSILLVNPIRGFIKALMKVRGGNYQTNIQMVRTDEFSQMSDSINQMVKGLLHRERMKRFVSDQAFESTKASENNLVARRMELSVLTSDIRGFTTISEKYDAAEIVSLLNDYFTEMEEAIVSNHGKIDRFVGDAIIAIFDTGDLIERSLNAVNAAFSMRKKLKEINTIREAEKKFLIENGVGIAAGIAVCGPTGKNSAQMDFAVVGDLVGKANELEALAKQGKYSKIIICEDTFNAAKKDFSIEEMEIDKSFKAYEVKNGAPDV